MLLSSRSVLIHSPNHCKHAQFWKMCFFWNISATRNEAPRKKAHFPRSTDQNSTFSRFSHSATIAVDSAPRFHKRLTWCFYFYNLPDDAHSNQLAWKMCFFGIAALRISLPLPKKHIFQNSHHRLPRSILRGSLTTPNRKLNVSPAGKLCCEFHPMRPAGRERRESSRTPDATGTRGASYASKGARARGRMLWARAMVMP